MEERIAEGQRILAYLRRLQGGEGEDAPPAVQALDLPQLPILAIHARVPETAVPGTWRELAAELRAYLHRCRELSTQPVGAIFPDPFHDERAVNMTVFIPSPAEVRGQGRIVCDLLPGGLCATIRHPGPYALLHRSYEHLAAWMQRHGYEATGAPRGDLPGWPRRHHRPPQLRNRRHLADPLNQPTNNCAKNYRATLGEAFASPSRYPAARGCYFPPARSRPCRCPSAPAAVAPRPRCRSDWQQPGRQQPRKA